MIKKGVDGFSSDKFHLDWCQYFFYPSLRAQISILNNRMGTASALHKFILENSGPKWV
jgi:hypothetical protein